MFVILNRNNIPALKKAMHDLVDLISGEDDLMALATLEHGLEIRLKHNEQYRIASIPSSQQIRYNDSFYRIKSDDQMTTSIAIFLIQLINLSHLQGGVYNQKQLEKLLKPFRIL